MLRLMLKRRVDVDWLAVVADAEADVGIKMIVGRLVVEADAEANEG